MELGHTLFVTVHAVAATLALAGGILAVHTGRGFALHQVGVVVMTASLGPSLILGWAGFSPPSRAIFLGLAALALFMVVQCGRAGRVRVREIARIEALHSGSRPPVGPEFVGVLGFNLISLTVAGTIVPVLRVGGGTLGVLVAVAVTVALAHLLVERRRSRVAAALAHSVELSRTAPG